MERVVRFDDGRVPSFGCGEDLGVAPPPAAFKEVHDVCGLTRSSRVDASPVPGSPRCRPCTQGAPRTGGPGGVVPGSVHAPLRAQPGEPQPLTRLQRQVAAVGSESMLRTVYTLTANTQAG